MDKIKSIKPYYNTLPQIDVVVSDSFVLHVDDWYYLVSTNYYYTCDTPHKVGVIFKSYKIPLSIKHNGVRGTHEYGYIIQSYTP